VKRLAVVLGVLLAGLSASCTPVRPAALADQVTIRFHYSHFEPATVTVPAGVPVTITLRNEDPIDHEWIVGAPDIHEDHRHGTEMVHDQRPTEVTVPALSSRVTTIIFDETGAQAYVCHLPGHEEYGMSGTLRIMRTGVEHIT
jgi:uncharacterized cupredoxin-like copper-binding protein